MKRWLKWNSKSLLLISLTYKSKGEYGIRLEVTQLTYILEPRHSTYPFTVIISAFKGALSRQSGSFCLILPITCPQLLWNLKWAKKLHINDKIRDLRQTNMSPRHCFWSCKQQGSTLKNCWAEQFSKTLILIRFNLLPFCPSVAYVVSVMLF